MIVTCGEALIDFLPRTGAGGADTFEPKPGGSIANVAIAVARLGAPAGFLGGLSTDLFGDQLRAHFSASNVNLSLVQTSDRPSTLAFVTLQNGSARYAFFDEHSAGRMLTDADMPALPKEVAALHFGSFSLAAEPCGSAYEMLMQREQRDRVISLDVNVRPSLIRNRDGYLARMARLVGMSDIVKLSDEDFAWLDLGAGFETIANRWLEAGARIVVLTRGADGAIGVTPSGTTVVAAVPAKVADTVGAGDTFTAAMLARLRTRGLLTKDGVANLLPDDVTDLLQYAAMAAAITVSRPGADPPWLKELG